MLSRLSSLQLTFWRFQSLFQRKQNYHYQNLVSESALRLSMQPNIKKTDSSVLYHLPIAQGTKRNPWLEETKPALTHLHTFITNRV